jgi:hypothetical protein
VANTFVALEAAKQSKMREVNLGLDEKFLSTGIEVNVDPSTLEVTVKGDVHLFYVLCLGPLAICNFLSFQLPFLTKVVVLS